MNSNNTSEKTVVKLPRSWAWDIGRRSDFRKEWVGMPEYEQTDERPIQKIIVSFLTREDVDTFARLLNCPVTIKTKSLWFPYRHKEVKINLAYVDEE